MAVNLSTASVIYAAQTRLLELAELVSVSSSFRRVKNYIKEGEALIRYIRVLQTDHSLTDEEQTAICQHMITIGNLYGFPASPTITSNEIFNFSSVAITGATGATGPQGAQGPQGNPVSVGTIDSVVKSANGAIITGGDLILQTADVSFPGVLSTGAQTIAGVKTFNGNVGIGGAPTYNLDIQTAAAHAQLRVITAGALNQSEIILGRTAGTLSSWSIYTPSASEDLRFYSGGDRMILTSGGNVGIGTTSPNAPLQFSNAIVDRKIVLYESADNDHQFYGFGITSIGSLRYQVPGTVDAHVWYAGTSSTTSSELMRLTGTGYLGIGTSTPHAPLQFANGVALRKIVLNEGGDNDHQFSGFGTAGDGMVYQVDNVVYSHIFKVGTSSTTSNELMRLTGDGNLGIGGAPTYPLDVFAATGTARITSTGTGPTSLVLSRTAGTLSEWSVYTPAGSTDIKFYSGADRFSFSTGGVGTATNWAITSDKRLKTNITKIDTNLLEKIKKIGSLVSEYDRLDGSGHETGFIAQELLEIAPEYVNIPDNEDQMLSVNYARMTALLFKGFQQLLENGVTK